MFLQLQAMAQINGSTEKYLGNFFIITSVLTPYVFTMAHTKKSVLLERYVEALRWNATKILEKRWRKIRDNTSH
jgi:hypothetical protein